MCSTDSVYVDECGKLPLTGISAAQINTLSFQAFRKPYPAVSLDAISIDIVIAKECAIERRGQERRRRGKKIAKCMRACDVISDSACAGRCSMAAKTIDVCMCICVWRTSAYRVRPRANWSRQLHACAAHIPL